MVFTFEFIHSCIEFSNKLINTFEVMFLESVELLFGLENFNQFKNSSFKNIEFPEDLSFTKIKMITSWKILYFFFNGSVLLLIAYIKFDTALENLDKFFWISIPDSHLFGLLVITELVIIIVLIGISFLFCTYFR